MNAIARQRGRQLAASWRRLRAVVRETQLCRATRRARDARRATRVPRSSALPCRRHCPAHVRRGGLEIHQSAPGRGGVVPASRLTPLADGGDLLARLPRLDAPRLVFVDGEFRAELSALPRPVEFARFAETGFGTLARPDSEPLVALNTMLAEDGAVIVGACRRRCRTAATGQPRATRCGVAFHPRHTVRLGAAPG